MENATVVEPTEISVEGGVAEPQEVHPEIDDQEIDETGENASVEETDIADQVAGNEKDARAFREMRIEAETNRRENLLLKQQLEYIRQLQTQPKKEEEPVDKYDDDDVLTAKEVKELLAQKEKENEGRTKEQRINSQAKEIREHYPDYLDTLPVFTDICQKVPELYDDVMGSANPPLLAYAIGNLFKKNGKEVDPAVQKKIQKIEKNATRPKTLTDAPTGKEAIADSIKKYANMSPEEFEKEMNKRKGFG